MAEEQWPTLEEIEAQDRGRIDEAKVAAHRERMRDEQRAHRLAEIRRLQGLTQNDVAAAMHVSQRRVSAVERGALTRTELGTVASYVAALGGCVEIVANFGDERIVIASGEPGMIAMGDGDMIALTPEANEGQSRPDLSDRVQARRLQRPTTAFCEPTALRCLAASSASQPPHAGDTRRLAV
jgi:transcriptional regulator with XRE-family HTH domain